MISQISPPCQPNYGEILAACLAVSLARSLNHEKFIIEGDLQEVILSMQNPQNFLDWRILSIIYDIIDSLLISIFWSVIEVNRNANFCVHLVIHWAVARYFYSCISTAPPPSATICFYCKSK
jgi:hypothetical protein